MVSQLVEAPGTFLKAAESLIDMRIPTTAQVACVVFAITRFLGTRHGVESRILRAVELPISLARAILGTGPFNSNFHGFYFPSHWRRAGGPSSCNVGLETWRISSIGGLPVYGYRWLEDGYRLSAYAANPSFVAFLNYLHIRITGVCTEFAVLIYTQECHPRL
jgi:hypothetical protein